MSGPEVLTTGLGTSAVLGRPSARSFSGGTTGASGSDGAPAGSGAGSGGRLRRRRGLGLPLLPRRALAAPDGVLGRSPDRRSAPASAFGTGAYAGGGVADCGPVNGPEYVDAPVTGGGAVGTVVPSGTMNNAMM